MEEARRPYAEEAMKKIPRAYWSSDAGRSALDSVWRQAVRAEAQVGEGEAAASCFWDIRKFFDRIPWYKLVARSLRAGLPAALVRALVSTYEHGRFLQL